MRMPSLTAVALLPALAADLPPARAWLDRLAFLVPGTAATRWLLLVDFVCLAAVGGSVRRPLLGVPFAVGAGFLALNVVSMAVGDFYLGFALFHLAVGVTAILLPQTRWAGLALTCSALALGILT